MRAKFKTPMLAVFGLVLVSITLVIGVIVGTLLPQSAIAAPDSLSGWITTTATVIICVLTIVLAVETWRLRAIQAHQIHELFLDSIRPNVSVELSNSPSGVNLMNVRVANSGKGIARKIKFEFLNRNDQLATEEEQPIIKVFHKLAMLRLGVQSLGINQELKSFIFSFFELRGQLGTDIFSPYVNIRIRFEDVNGNEYVNIFVVDFSQYEGISAVGEDSLKKLADEAKSIRQEFAKVI